MTTEKKNIAFARGDGIGPEIMDATLNVLEATNAPLSFEEVKIGKEVYESGYSSGITPESWELVRKNKNLLKAPITTPQGGGYKSLNVTLRKSLGMFANVRPCQAYSPYIQTAHPDMDMVVVRENEEDVYGAIEHQQTNEVAQCLKLITRPGSESVIRYAFEYARAYGRKKVTCMTKDNIMKLTDGLFHKVFDEVKDEYPDIESEHRIIDIGSAEVATRPEDFDVVVTLNLYGDIISDITAQLAGSVGMAGSANIGRECSMFEAIHGSAPDISGKDIANPSGIINSAVMLLAHLNEFEAAENVRNAWLKTLEDGVHTPDIYNESISSKKVGTKEFGEAVKQRLGEKPQTIKSESFKNTAKGIKLHAPARTANNQKKLTGIDVFLFWDKGDRNPDELGKELEKIQNDHLKLKMVTNRGTKVYPDGMPETFSTDHWRCRYVAKNEDGLTHSHILDLLKQIEEAGFDFVKTEHLYEINGQKAYSLGQGE